MVIIAVIVIPWIITPREVVPWAIAPIIISEHSPI
jgi:hypothetical protein